MPRTVGWRPRGRGADTRLGGHRTSCPRPARSALLLCDETCSGLTEAETACILNLLRKIDKDGTTILYVEHNLRAIMSVSQHVIVMNYGQKLAEGTPQMVQNDPAVTAVYIVA